MTEADFNPQYNGFTSSELAGDLLCEGDIKCITSIDANNNKLLIPALRGLAEDDVLLVGLGGNGVGERKSYRFTELLGLYRTRENATSGIVFGQLTMLGSGGSRIAVLLRLNRQILHGRQGLNIKPQKQ